MKDNLKIWLSGVATLAAFLIIVAANPLNNAIGNIAGPGSGTDNAVPTWDGTGGNSLQDTAVFITDAEDMIIGHTAVISSTAQEFQVSTVTAGGGIGIYSNSETDSIGPRILFTKSGNATRGSVATIVADNENLGDITFNGADGTDLATAAQISAEVDGTPSDGTDMPGALVFSTTPDGSGTLVERMRIDSAGRISSITNTGTAGSGATVLEFGDGFNHVTRIDLGTAVFPSITGDTAQAVGFLAYTFPAGVIYIDAIHMDVAINGVTAIQGDTPDVGLGTVIATGGVSVLGGTATFEDWINGTAAADANGTDTDVTTIPNVSTLIVLEASEVHLVHFNAADLWDDAVGGDASADLTGQIWIAWRFLGA